MSAPNRPLSEITLLRMEYIRAYKASARKSFGSFKPVVVKGDGSTEVCGQRAELRNKVWVDGRPDPKTAYVQNHRGVTFQTRDEATAYARACIEELLSTEQQRYDMFLRIEVNRATQGAWS